MAEAQSKIFQSARSKTPLVDRRFRFDGDDVALVEAVRAGEERARAELYDRFAPQIRRVLARVLGVDGEIPDLLQEVFAEGFAGIDRLDDDERVGNWLIGIAVHTGRRCIRRRRYERWFSGLWNRTSFEPERANDPPDYEGRAALRSAYQVLEQLSVEQRILFSLRYLDGMELTELAAATGVSLATVKRRLSRARSRFAALAKHHPTLERWLEPQQEDRP